MKSKKRFATTGEIAKLCEVSPKTVISWIDRKELPSFRIGRGPRKVSLHDLFVFLVSKNFPITDLTELTRILELQIEVQNEIKMSQEKFAIPV